MIHRKNLLERGYEVLQKQLCRQLPPGNWIRFAADFRILATNIQGFNGRIVVELTF